MKVFLSLVPALLLLTTATGKPSRIVNGAQVPQGKYPFVVSIQNYYGFGGTDHHCAATILNENWIMTAASCLLRESNPYYHIIYAGSVDVETATGNNLYLVQQEIPHPDFVYDQASGFSVHDIALLQVDIPFDFSNPNRMAPVSLPQAGVEIVDGEEAALMGWGYTVNNTAGQNRKLLMETSFSTLSDASCPNTVSPELFVCASDPEMQSGPCRDDRGGPLLVNNVQVGIVASLKMCQDQPNDGIDLFTEVAAHLDWINSIINA